MTEGFHREDRYIVIKHKDLGNVPVAYREHLVRPLFALQAHLPVRECVVVESDWPEYETVWQMIERRMTEQPPVSAAEELAAVLHWRGKHAQAVRERDALQQRLNGADQRVDDLQSGLTKARDMVRWFYTHANVHQVGTAMMDAARDFIAHQSAPAAKCKLCNGFGRVQISTVCGFTYKPCECAPATKAEHCATCAKLNGSNYCDCEQE